MPPKAFISFVGFVLLMAATWCPLIGAFGLISQNVYDLNKPYGMVLLLMSVVGVACIVLKQYKVARIVSLVSLGLVVLLYIAALLKVYHAFSFIPFKGIEKFFIGMVKFKWGWYMLFAGPILSVLANPKLRTFYKPEDPTLEEK